MLREGTMKSVTKIDFSRMVIKPLAIVMMCSHKEKKFPGEFFAF